MISFFKLKAKSLILNRGMTYVELIVVLGIFSAVSSVVLFDYGKFQNKVDIKVLANDVAIKIVEAQKSSIGGKWSGYATTGWKPSYGLYFNVSENTTFTYFADLNNNSYYNASNCQTSGECIEQFLITKGSHLSSIELTGTSCPATVDNINIIFKRPNTGAIITSNPPLTCTVSSVSLNLSSGGAPSSVIEVYPSGRVQIR